MKGANACLLELDQLFRGDEVIKMQSCVRLQRSGTEMCCRSSEKGEKEPSTPENTQKASVT